MSVEMCEPGHCYRCGDAGAHERYLSWDRICQDQQHPEPLAVVAASAWHGALTYVGMADSSEHSSRAAREAIRLALIDYLSPRNLV